MEIQKFALLNSEGLPVAFYSSEVHGKNIPNDAILISQEQWQEFIDNPGLRRWNSGKVVSYTPPASLPTLDDYRYAIQNHIDIRAKEKQYDSGSTLASYISSTVPQWSQEAREFVSWRDRVWEYALAELEKVENGNRDQPSIEKFLAELPE